MSGNWNSHNLFDVPPFPPRKTNSRLGFFSDLTDRSEDPPPDDSLGDSFFSKNEIPSLQKTLSFDSFEKAALSQRRPPNLPFKNNIPESPRGRGFRRSNSLRDFQLPRSSSPRWNPPTSSPWNSPRPPPRGRRYRKCGLYVKRSDSMREAVPLRQVDVQANILDLFSHIRLDQRYYNVEPNPIEIEFIFPIAKHATISEFSAEVDGRLYRGEIIDKIEAFDKYESTNEELYFEDEDAKYVFKANLGVLPPNAEARIILSYVGEVMMKGTDLIFTVPNTVLPEKADPLRQDHIERGSWRREEDSSLSRLSYKFNLEVFFSMTSPLLSIISTTHSISISYQNDKKEAHVCLQTVPAFDTDFELCIKLSNPHIPHAIVENYKDTQVISFILCPDFTNVELYPDNAAFTNVRLTWGSLDVIQTPLVLRPILDQGRLLVYALLKKPTKKKEEVKLKVMSMKGPCEFSCVADPSKARDDSMLHKLAVRRRIRELERDAFGDHKNEIIQLSRKYNIASQFTAFLAVQQKEGEVKQKKAIVPRLLSTRWDAPYPERRGPPRGRGHPNSSSSSSSSSSRGWSRSSLRRENSGDSFYRDHERSLNLSDQFDNKLKIEKDRLEQITDLQQEDGSWLLDMNFAGLLSLPLESLQNAVNQNETTLWGTAIAIAYLQIVFDEYQSSWRLSELKAKQFLGSNADYWIKKASDFIQQSY